MKGGGVLGQLVSEQHKKIMWIKPHENLVREPIVQKAMVWPFSL